LADSEIFIIAIAALPGARLHSIVCSLVHLLWFRVGLYALIWFGPLKIQTRKIHAKMT